MKATFRVDASLEMGTGHVMRCLTLANALKEQGAECHFICRKHPGNLIETVQQAGFQVHSLTTQKKSLANNQPQNQANKDKPLFHAAWLGATQAQDAQDCQPILKQLQPDWLIVDHYALDKTWQQALKPYYKKLMAIDDLGDREHLANLLLDQNYGATAEKYQNLVPESCKLLTGTHYALLRPEFAHWREYSLKRRSKNTQIKNILVTLGGADPDNYTAKILAQLAKSELNPLTEITVIMGATASHLEAIKLQAAALPISTQVKANVSNMAELMSKADLAIGAAGATTWERCCLGLPTIQLVIAENQRKTAEALAKDQVVKLLKQLEDLPSLITNINSWLPAALEKSPKVTDGLGCHHRLVPIMMPKENITLNLKRFGAVNLLDYTQLTASEALQVLTMRNHPDVRQWMYNKEEIPEDEHFKFIEALKNDPTKKHFLVEKAGQKLGVINFSVAIANKTHTAELGLFASFTNQNPMTAFILEQTAINYAFEVMGLDCLYAEVFQDNKQVIRLHKKFGFIETPSQQPKVLKFKLLKEDTRSL